MESLSAILGFLRALGGIQIYIMLLNHSKDLKTIRVKTYDEDSEDRVSEKHTNDMLTGCFPPSHTFDF